MNEESLGMADRAAILDLCVAYNWLTDTGNAAGVAGLFIPGGVFDAPPGRFEGKAEIEKFNQDIHSAIRGSMHFNDNHQFELDGDQVRHRCYSSLQIATPDGVRTQLMTYEDVIVRVDGQWRFRERVNRLFAPAADD
jgi:ketosteroid isomerase-like protein